MHAHRQQQRNTKDPLFFFLLDDLLTATLSSCVKNLIDKLGKNALVDAHLNPLPGHHNQCNREMKASSISSGVLAEMRRYLVTRRMYPMIPRPPSAQETINSLMEKERLGVSCADLTIPQLPFPTSSSHLSLSGARSIEHSGLTRRVGNVNW